MIDDYLSCYWKDFICFYGYRLIDQWTYSLNFISSLTPSPHCLDLALLPPSPLLPSSPPPNPSPRPNFPDNSASKLSSKSSANSSKKTKTQPTAHRPSWSSGYWPPSAPTPSSSLWTRNCNWSGCTRWQEVTWSLSTWVNKIRNRFSVNLRKGTLTVYINTIRKITGTGPMLMGGLWESSLNWLLNRNRLTIPWFWTL